MVIIARYVGDLKAIPNTFNIGECILQVNTDACPTEEFPICFPDVWIYLLHKLRQENLKPDDAVLPNYWKLNLLTRVYVELNNLEEARKANEKALECAGDLNIVALANSVVILRYLGNDADARDSANELNERLNEMAAEFRDGMINAISEQAYYHYMFSSRNSYNGITILKFVAHLRNGIYQDHEKYLMLRFYRKLVHPENESNRIQSVGEEIVTLLHDIETNTQDSTMRALVYIEMERILNDNTQIQGQFSRVGEHRNQQTFIALALQHGEKNPTILLEVGLNYYKRNNPNEGKVFMERSFELVQTERASRYLAQIYLKEALELRTSVENKKTEEGLYLNERDPIRRYLLRYAYHLDCTKDEKVREKLQKVLYFSQIRFKLIEFKTLKHIYKLALWLVKNKCYSEACQLIDSNLLVNERGINNIVVEIHIQLLRALAEEAQNSGSSLSTVSRTSLMKAVKLGYADTDESLSSITDNRLLNKLQKIPKFIETKFLNLNGNNVNQKIKDYLSKFGPATVEQFAWEFNAEYQETIIMRSIVSFIESKNLKEAANECDKIINSAVESNIFSKIQALILKAKITESQSTDPNILKSKSLLEKAYHLYFKSDTNKNVVEKRLLKFLLKFPLKYHFFYMKTY